MASVTRTMNPLPLEHLEPKRFEDLVRQLAYDFRQWRSLEATGRSGSDGGYDVRGWEIVPDADQPPLNEGEEEPQNSGERRWLFQCKREQTITPAKLKSYLEETPEAERKGLYGLVFATCANLSKKSRDQFMETCRSFGITECFIWSHAEIEDMLFQPKNDGLLFAYFGISLRIKQRSVKTKLRSQLTIKRKLYTALGSEKYLGKDVLLRDPEDEKYPYLYEDEKRENHHWQVMRAIKHHPLGIWVETRRYEAYLDDNGKNWDIANVCNEADGAALWSNPWNTQENHDAHRGMRTEISNYSRENIDEKNRGILVVERLIKYEDILDVDKDGDAKFKDPIIFTTFKDGSPPFGEVRATLIVQAVMEHPEKGPAKEIAPLKKMYNPDLDKRIEVFPKKYRKEIGDKRKNKD